MLSFEFIIGLVFFSVVLYKFLKISSKYKQPKLPNDKIIVTALHLFPIKSCKGMSVKEWPICDKGLMYDRKWIIVDKKNNKFVTQRTHPKMCFIEAVVDLKTGDLTISIPNEKKYILTRKVYEKLEQEQLQQKQDQVEIWNSKFEAIKMGDDIGELLSRFIGKDVELYMYPSKQFSREASAEYTKPFSSVASNFNVGFADGFPYLLVNEKSVQDLQTKIKTDTKVQYLRFRPNIVVNSANDKLLTSWDEDLWKTILIKKSNNKVPVAKGQNENIYLYNCKPCTRCSMPTVDFTTGKKNEDVLDLLQRERMGKDPYKNPIVGVNLIHHQDAIGKFIAVGDHVIIEDKYEKLPFELDTK